ncbi:HD domain-containing protein [Leptospira levettii]|uniref:HD domain-containing protein n=1 Tax=Leptospira levettii TaxID=2023178 RepID=A0AAW5VEF5_9LEPT|nr:HD domain-containing protein [Leptospira levettii]MCW7512097.1 HD domain-containing protein [Leptospira levettii]MCW7517164.1 HD domain-containing protein [Leptospira levettii]
MTDNLRASKGKLGKKFNEALVFASELHAEQTRKGTEIPYITHLLAVASIIGECGGTEVEIIAGLLHDSVEDQGGKETLELIKQKFGIEVAEIVLECSDTDIVPKPPWKERKTAYLNHLKESMNQSVILVSCADKLHNLRSIKSDLSEIGDLVWNRFSAQKEEAIWYYRELLKIYKVKDAPRRLTIEMEEIINWIGG